MEKDSPFVEYEIMELNSPETKKEILEYLEMRFRKFNNARYSWVDTLDNPKLRLDYNDETEFIDTNTRAYPFFSLILDFIESNKLSLEAIQFEPNKSAAKTDENVYLILKIRTNRLSALRQNYSFSSKVAELIHIATTSEEVEDGFLIFYKDREAFEDSQVNRLDLNELKVWLLKKGIWKDSYMELFEAMLESIEFDKKKKQRKIEKKQ